MIVNIVENSYGKDYLKMDEEFFQAFSKGKSENYEMIYGNKKVQRVYDEEINPMVEEIYWRLLEDAKAHNKNSIIYKHHISYVNKLAGYYSGNDYENNTPEDIVVDFIASMTDDYFVDLYKYLVSKRKAQG